MRMCFPGPSKAIEYRSLNGALGKSGKWVREWEREKEKKIEREIDSKRVGGKRKTGNEKKKREGKEEERMNDNEGPQERQGESQLGVEGVVRGRLCVFFLHLMKLMQFH